MKKSDNTKFVSCPGRRLIPNYRPVIDKNGHMELEECGCDDIQELINSYADETDLRTILARVKAGQIDLLDVAKGQYGDFTGGPKTLAEALQMQIDSGRMFADLSPEMKAKFNNDPNEFFAQAGTAEWFDKLGSTLPEQMRSMNNRPPAQTEVDASSSTTEVT